MSAQSRRVLQRFFDGRLRPGEMVEALSNYHRMHPVRVVKRGREIRPLAGGGSGLPEIVFEDRGRRFDLYDYLATNRVAGLLIMKEGQVVTELYELGVAGDTGWASCSIAKSIASTLVGVAVREGAIASLDDPLTRYVPKLKRGAYAEVSVRQLLQMSSGVAWDETYTNPASDRRRLLEIQYQLRADAILAHMSGLQRKGPPGSSWVYNTGESYLLGPLLAGATGVHPADYLSEKLWGPLGMEADARWWSLAGEGMVLAGSGMSARMRDYARFGQFVLDEGRIDGVPIVPDGWFREAGAAQEIGGERIPYGYMWWIPVLQDPILEGAFQAEGIYGQYLHVNPAAALAIVVLSARPKPSFRSRVEFDDDAFFAGVARSLA